MFIKLLTIITSLFVGGVKAPPSIHKQRQTNTIKETYVEKSWELYNTFIPNQSNLSSVGFEYYIDGDNAIVLHNILTSGERVLNITHNFVDGHTYFFNWKLYSDPTNVNFRYYLYGFNSDYNYDRPFIETFDASYEPTFLLQLLDYNGGASEMFFYLNIIDLTDNPIPILDNSMEEYYTQTEVDKQVDDAITETINKNNPLYSMYFDYILSPGDSISRIPLPFRDGDFTRLYKSDLYNTINSIVGNVSNNFTIQIDLPMKNTRDLNIFAKGNNLELKKFGTISYSYTQGNNIFSINLPNDNREFNSIFLSFYNFNSIDADDVVLSVSNRIEETSYQEGYDKGLEVGNKEGYDKGLTDGHNEGYEQGHGEGFQLGYDTGNKDGYDTGYNKGYNDGLSKEDVNPFKLVSTAFESVGKILSVNVFGGITIATLIAIPFMFLVVLFILKLMKG